MEKSDDIELFPVGISQLTSLHTLKGVVVGRRGNDNGLKLTDLKGLTLLQHLSLTIASIDDALSSSSKGIQLEEGVIKVEEEIFKGMTKMQILDFRNVDETRFLNLPEDMKLMQGLEIVRLSRCVVPKWIFELQNLMELDVGAQNFIAEDYKSLTKIPHLRKLVLWDDHNCIKFPKEFKKPMAFPKLEWFEVIEFNCLEKFPSLQDNAMPMLKHLAFRWCHLRKLSKELQWLKNLQEVTVWRKMDPQVEHDFFLWSNPDRGRPIMVDIRIEAIESGSSFFFQQGLSNFLRVQSNPMSNSYITWTGNFEE
jgi:hypothetical protein